MASSRRSAGWAAVLLLCLAAPRRLPAQAPTPDNAPLVLAGRLLLARATDTTALPATWVVAHRVGPQRQGAVDSVRSDPAGRFRFLIARPESAAVYVVSAQYAGIGYFSEPFDGATRQGADAIGLAVFDTATGGPPLGVTVRHVVVTRPSDDGSRRVLDIITVHNPGAATRVSADSTAPTWTMRLPEGVTAFEVGESEVAASAIRFEGGTLAVTAPFPPGDKQVVITYVLPSGAPRLTIPVDQPTALLEVLAEDSTSSAEGRLVRGDPMPLENHVFLRFSAEHLAVGAAAAVRFTPGNDPAQTYWWLPVAAAGLLLALGGYYATRVARR